MTNEKVSAGMQYMLTSPNPIVHIMTDTSPSLNLFAASRRVEGSKDEW